MTDTSATTREAVLLGRVAELEAQLHDSEETLDAIRRGEIDALVVGGRSEEQQVYTLDSADRPYRVLIEQIQEGAVTLAEDGTILYCNRRLALLLGAAQERVIGQSLRPYVAPGQEVAFDRLLGEGRQARSRGELLLRTTAKTEISVLISLSPLDGSDGSTLLCGVLTDLTEQKRRLEEMAETNARLEGEIAERVRIEEALRQSQKMEAIGQLTGGVAHDFNNLLTVIRSSVDLLKRPGLPEERRARYTAAISDTVERAAKLTRQLLAFARRQALKPEIFAACQSVRMIGEMMGTLTGSRVRIVTQLPERQCFVNADPSQFDTALVNLAANARDAMEGEGQLTITVQTVEGMPAIRLHPAIPGSFVAVSIADTGCGIPPEHLDQIFEPFFTTKPTGQGTGLGLSQVFGFAKQSGGEVMVESRLGEGTTFTLYMPLVAEAGRPDENSEPAPLVDGHGTCVLVVEDNEAVGAFATDALTELGYRPVLAASAEAALAELARDADRFDVVFSDVVMPGMGGIELGQRIRRDHHDLPVVLTSGYSHVLAQNGTYGFELLHKPYSIEQLSRVLRKAATWQRRRRILRQS
ncbi:ATP-binding protein [Muricoccus vinaceus]|uniref:histidine kinase n=1 Tax=Muricoccus vinaceus TaxID=424704 RepID=A0ABV6IWF6_9PROT